MGGTRRWVAACAAATIISAGLTAGTMQQASAETIDPGGGPTPAAVAATDLTINGKGFGHGRGMSQYGAQGQALAGRSATQILDFYYPGSATGTTSGYVRVWTTADTSPGIYVRATSGLRARSLSTNTAWTLPTSSTVTSWILAPYGDHQTRLSYYRSSTRTWVLWKTLAGMGQFEGRYEASLVTMVLPNGTTVTYRGRLRTADRPGTDLDTLNVLTMEYYLRGVVPKEAITSWRPAALQAQAVAARTYADRKRRAPLGSDYDLCDTTSCQVYGGAAAEVASTNSAIAATSGRIRTYSGQPIDAQFSSSNGGYTAPGGLAYLPAKADPYDDYPHNGNPNANWTITMSKATAGSRLGVGTLTSLLVLSRNGFGTWGGRVVSVRATGTTATKTFTGEQARFALRLKSDWFLVAAQ
jgi:stage II sporulation protein D